VSQENVEMVRASLAAWNRRDVDGWLENAHPEVEWVSAIAQSMQGAETVYRGAGEMRGFWDEWHAIWDVEIDLTELRDLGDTVLALGSFRIRGDASGVGLEQPIAYVFEFEDGLARRVRSYLDIEQALDAVERR
jgi:ketosteroid isomerase-like protein